MSFFKAATFLIFQLVWLGNLVTYAQLSERSTEKPSSVSPSARGNEFEPTRVVAIVGGEPIFVGDMLFEINQLVARFMPNAPADLKKSESSALISKLLPKFIEQKLLLIDVKRDMPEGANFDSVVESASDEFDEKALDQLMESAGVSSPIMFDAHLRAQGSSLRKLRNSWTQDQLVRYFLGQKIKNDAEVSHQELLDYYRANQSNYEFKAKARWEQVMVKRSRYGTTAEAMTKIVELGNKIVYGASLAGVAKKSSDGFRASSGGQHDWTTKDSLVLKELDKAIFELPIGELSDVIKTNQGFHIIRVIERKDAGKTPFRDAQVEIKKKLETEKRVAAYDAHLQKLRDTIPVEILDPKAKSIHESRVAQSRENGISAR